MKTLMNKLMVSVLVLGLALQPSASALAQYDENKPVTIKITQVDTSNFPQVTAYVSAVDADGEPAPVNPEELVLRENGASVQPTLVQGAGDSGPLTTMLVIDTSGSMDNGGKMGMARKVAQDYISQMRSGDLAGVIAFNDKVKVAQEVTADKVALRTAVKNLRAGYDTAMYDALIKAADILNTLPGRKAVVVLTDGLDNMSVHTASDVLNQIGVSGLSISTIGLGNPDKSTGNITALDEPTLAKLAEKAGGAYSQASNEEALQLVYQKFGRALQSEYAITYTSSGSVRDGLNRNLTIALEAGNIAAWSEEAKTSFNPGGFIPETGGENTWPLFFELLALLVVMLIAPLVLRRTKKAQPAVPLEPAAETPHNGRVKLK